MLMLDRLREHGPIRPSTYVFAVIAETGLDRNDVREHLRTLVDDGLVGVGWDGELVAS